MAGRAERRELTTILFTDIVGSTQLAERLGDRRWREVLRRHHELVRREIRRAGGHEVDTAGDGFFVTFTRPADAIRCACAVSDAVRTLGLEIRAGLHFGEAVHGGRRVQGIAVHTGARVIAVAEPGEVLVTATLRDLARGAGFEFADRGRHRFKGIEDEFHLFAVVAIDGQPRAATLDPEVAQQRLLAIAPTERRRRNRVPLLGGAAAAVVAIAIALFAARPTSPVLDHASDATSPPTDATSPSVDAPPPLNSLIEVDPATHEVRDTLEELFPTRYSGNPRISIGEGAVWLVGFSEVLRVDLESRMVDSRRLPCRSTTEVVIASQLAWVGMGLGLCGESGGVAGPPSGGGLQRLHPSTSERLRRLFAGTDVSGLAAGAGWLWLTEISGTLMQIDPRTGELATSADLSGSPTGAVADSEAAWVIDRVFGTLTRIDPETAEPGPSIDVSANLDDVAIGEGAIWILDFGAGTVTAVDAVTHDIGPSIRVGTSPTDIAVGLGAVWVADQDGAIRRIDPLTQAITDEVDIGTPVSGIVVNERSETLWATLSTGAQGDF
jgi:class 3 adenylate cyclase